MFFLKRIIKIESVRELAILKATVSEQHSQRLSDIESGILQAGFVLLINNKYVVDTETSYQDYVSDHYYIVTNLSETLKQPTMPSGYLPDVMALDGDSYLQCQCLYIKDALSQSAANLGLIFEQESQARAASYQLRQFVMEHVLDPFAAMDGWLAAPMYKGLTCTEEGDDNVCE